MASSRNIFVGIHEKKKWVKVGSRWVCDEKKGGVFVFLDHLISLTFRLYVEHHAISKRRDDAAHVLFEKGAYCCHSF